tara:strand:- start:3917 stop:4477 length:561 start_codon:yes stop_codon:yes gene_type:complete
MLGDETPTNNDLQMLSLGQYASMSNKTRSKAVAAYLKYNNIDENQLLPFSLCMSDFAGTKNSELKLNDAMGWCSEQYKNLPEKYLDHYDELADIDLRMDLKAKVQCEQLIRRELVSPSSADFPMYDYKLYGMSRGRYRIKSYVEADNAYGTQIRMDWTCDIQYVGNNKTEDYYLPSGWKVNSLGFL